METKLINFNRRGAICTYNKSFGDKELKSLTAEEQVIAEAVRILNARYFVVMKRIDEGHMLVAPVFTAKRRECKSIRINNKQLWVNFMTFYVVPEQIMQAVPGKYLDYPYRTVTAIYSSHNNVLKEKWHRENEQRMIDQELRRRARERKYNPRRYNMDYLYQTPEYLQKDLKHPCSGGLVSAR